MTKIDLDPGIREQVIAILTARLADAVDLTAQAKQAHWNVKGPNFIALHELFDAAYEEAGGYTDLIAERIVTLGGTAVGTVQAAADRSSLPPYPTDIYDGALHVDALSTALAAFGEAVRKAIDAVDSLGDAGTADLFTEVSRGIDKRLWFVEAHRQSNR